MYRSEFEVESVEALLSGQIVVPEGATHVCILVHGSFVQNRDGDIDDTHKWFAPESVPKRGLFRDIEEILVSLGVACVRYDKRGSGKSSGEFSTSGLSLLSDDLMSIARFITIRYGMKLVVVGQSEGGVTSLLASSKGLEIETLILQNPMLVPLEKLLAFQKTRAAAPFLNNREILFKQLPVITEMYWRVYNDEAIWNEIVSGKRVWVEVEFEEQKVRIPVRLLRDYLNTNGLDLLANIHSRVHLIVSEYDGNCPYSTGDSVAEKYSDRSISIHRLLGNDHSFRDYKPGLNFIEAMEMPLSESYKRCFRGIIESVLC